MNCENAFEQMSAALDGELSVEETAQLDRHLAQCEACRALFDDLTAIHGACGGLEVAPPPALKAQILQNLPARKKTAKVVWVHWKRWAAMAASFVLIAWAAWQLPKTVFDPPPQPAAGLTEETQNVEMAPSAPVTPHYSGSGPAEEPAVSDKTATLFTSGPTTPADVVPSPTPTPDFFSSDPVDVNASQSAPKQVKHESQKRSMATEDAGDETDPVADSTYQGAEDLTTYDVTLTSAGDADAAPLFGFTAPMTPVPLGEAITITGFSDTTICLTSNSDEEAHQELQPEVTEEENVPITLFRGVIVDESGASTTYCGILTLQSDPLLTDCPAQIQETGEIWYKLPGIDFYTLVSELTDSETEFDLRTTGEDLSPDSPVGLVIVLPEEPTPEAQ